MVRSEKSDKIKLEGVLSSGYGIIPKAIMRDTGISVEAKAIYSYLSSFAGAGNTAFPSVSLMCHELGMGKNRFYKHRKMLVDKGYITIDRAQKEDGVWENNVYTLPNSPRIQNEGSTQNEDMEYEDMEYEDMEYEDMENEDTINNSSINNSSINNSSINNSINKSSSAELTERFEKLWGFYPRKIGKKKALASYKKSIKSGTTDEEIRVGIENYNKQIEIKNTDPKFIKHGSTWFNNESWNDDYETTNKTYRKDDPHDQYRDLF